MNDFQYDNLFNPQISPVRVIQLMAILSVSREDVNHFSLQPGNGKINPEVANSKG
jgi:hypothetical protein